MQYKSISRSASEIVSEDITKLQKRVSIDALFEVGAHLGHGKELWNPQMLPYVYGTHRKTGNHIIDLQKTVPLLNAALQKIIDVVGNSGRVLFIGTKMQASSIIKDAALRCGQYYVNLRWPSGLLTNWHTVSQSIKKLVRFEKMLEKDSDSLSKKEILRIRRKIEKIEKYLGGVREMGGLPSALVVIDPYKERNAVKEANKLGIPVVAIVDTNCSTDGIAFPIPGNDDLIGAIQYYCSLFSDAVLAGIKLECEFKKKHKPREVSDKDQEGKDNRDKRVRRDGGDFRPRPRAPHSKDARDNRSFRPQGPRRFPERTGAAPVKDITTTTTKERLGDNEDE